MSNQGQTRRGKAVRAGLAAVFLLTCASVSLRAQVSSYGDKQGDLQSQQLPTVLNRVQIAQRLDQQLPLDAEFKDESGKAVRLGDYFGKRPVIFSLVYFKCPILCSEELNGLASALEMVSYRPGKDFDIVVVSIDPSEGPALAAQQKQLYVKRYGHPETGAGWHFLTGEQPAISAVAKAAGFGYVRVPGPDGKMTQFAHASSIEIATPEGKLAQYYMGVEYSPKDIRLGLVEASEHKIGTPVDNILTYCYHYDPQTNRHSLVIARVVQLGGVATVLALGSFMFVMFRRDVRDGRNEAVRSATDRSGTAGRNYRVDG